MEVYLKKIKELPNNLLLAGNPIYTDDLITQTLAGLDAEYNPVVVQLAEKSNLTWVELQVSLLTFESRLEQLTSINNYSQPTVNLAMNRPKNSHGSNQGLRAQQNRGRGKFNRGRSNFARTNTKPTCQLCTKVGHTALNCFFRFDQSFNGVSGGNM